MPLKPLLIVGFVFLNLAGVLSPCHAYGKCLAGRDSLGIVSACKAISTAGLILFLSPGLTYLLAKHPSSFANPVLRAWLLTGYMADHIYNDARLELVGR